MPTKRTRGVSPKPTAHARIPSGFRSVTPYLSVEGAAEAMEFYKRAFGAKELARQAAPDGRLLHGRLRIGDSIVMLSDSFAGALTSPPPKLGGSTVALHVYSTDVDRLWSRAVSAGAKISMPLENQFWGERYGQLIDPFGHRWSLSQPVRMSRAERKLLEEQALARFPSEGAAPAENAASP